MKPDRRQIEKAVETYKRFAGKNFVLASKLGQKQISNAINSFDKYVKPEKVVALLDTSLFGNGKSGILVSEEKISFSENKTGSIYLENMVKAEYSKDRLAAHFLSGGVRRITIKNYGEEAASLMNAIAKEMLLAEKAKLGSEMEEAAKEPEEKAPERKPPEIKEKPMPTKKETDDEVFSKAVKLYSEGRMTEAFECFKKLAEKGNVNAIYNVGVFYNTGKAVPQNKKEAFRWFEKAAEKGHINGQYVCGKALIDGTIVERDYKKAAFWLKKAADQGDEEAAKLLRSIRYIVEEIEEAEEFAVPQLGEEEILSYSRDLYRKGKIRESFLCCKKAAKMDCREAQYVCGRMYYSGEGTEKDFAEAARWFMRAAERGHISAMIELSEMIIKGEAKIYDSFLRLLEKEAKEEIPGACYYLGLMYYFGKGMRKDFVKAYFYVEKSELLGYMNKNIGFYLEKIKSEYEILNGEDSMCYFYRILSEMYKKENGNIAYEKAMEYMKKAGLN